MHNDPVNLRDLWGLTASDSNNQDSRKCYETTNSFLSINETVSNTDIEIVVAFSKNNVTVQGQKTTKVDVSMYVNNSVGKDPNNNGGVNSKYALASQMTVTVSDESNSVSMTSLANSFESNSVTLTIPGQNNDVLVTADIYVIATNQNSIEETFDYKVTFK